MLLCGSQDGYAFNTDSPTSINSARQTAVRKAWQQERELVMKTGRGTRDWSPAEKKELIETGRVKGVEGHHQKDVSRNPEKAGDPDNIKFVKDRQEHLREHGGSFRQRSKGGSIRREKMLADFTWSRSSLNAAFGALQFAGGAALVWNYLPETLQDFDVYARGGKTDKRVLYRAVDSGLFTGAGVASTVAGSARVTAYLIAKAQAKHMHSILGPLRYTSKAAGVVSVILVVAEQGVYTYRWDQGYISTPEFIKRTSVAAGALAGAAVGAKLGEKATKSTDDPWVKAGGQLAGAAAGAAAGAWGATKITDDYYERIDREQEEAYLDHQYASYGQERVWTNDKLYSE